MSGWGAALEDLRSRESGSFGSAVIDVEWDLEAPSLAVPPAALGEMPMVRVAKECARVLLPGSVVALRVPSRLVDIAGLALRLAGFEFRDSIAVLDDEQPSYWIIARAALDGTLPANVLKHGTGVLNVRDTRIAAAGGASAGKTATPGGRFTPNVILSPAAAIEMDRQAPVAGAGGPASGPTFSGASKSNSMAGHFSGMGDRSPSFHADSGGASRFFPTVDTNASDWIGVLIGVPAAPTLNVPAIVSDSKSLPHRLIA